MTCSISQGGIGQLDLKILVAEDNAVNQTVIVRMLEKIGYSPVLAQNGSDALALALTQNFDLVLMDVQMPGMDGLAATAAIRESEAGSGKHLPIFAMTAQPTKDDRERCTTAGMDGYISKPVRFSDIQQVLTRLASMTSVAPNPAMPTAPLPAMTVKAWNRAELLGRIEGDEKLLTELCQIFLEESLKLLETLRRAVEAGDADGIMRAAHSLKGEASYLGAAATSRAARQLEQIGQNKDLSRAGDSLAILEREVARLHLDLKEPIGL